MSAELAPEIARRLESSEAQAAEDRYHFAPPELVSSLGLQMLREGGAVTLLASRVDILVFNRLVGLGIHEPASEALIDRALSCAAAAAVPRFFIHVAPSASPAALYSWLGARGLTHASHWAKLYRGTQSLPEVVTDLRIEPLRSAARDALAALLPEVF